MTPCVSSREEVWEGDRPSRPLKIAVIREELVALTGDPFIAVILNQLLYWTQRVKDFDLLLEEERTFNQECNVLPRHGWIYKSAEDLIDETMLRVSRVTMRRYLSHLVEGGWVDEKTNPRNKWDKTTQYRVNLRKLQEALFALGYDLAGFPSRELSLKKIRSDPLKTAETPMLQNEPSIVQNETSKHHFEPSNVQKCSFIYLNRDYSENINRDHTQRAHEFQNNSVQDNSVQNIFDQKRMPQKKQISFTIQCLQKDKEKPLFEEAIETWQRHVGQTITHLTPERERQLSSLLNLFFQNDLREWEKFCERIKASPFLMGQGPNKWHVTFDWILLENNALKVLEGNFDSSESLQQKQTEMFQASSAQIRKQILKSIKDPIWREWCEQLSESNQISLFELEELSGAKFMEFDGNLVWLRCAEQKTLNRIESVRLKLLSIVQRQFPKARNIRTQIEEENNEIRPPFHSPLKTDLSSHTGSVLG